MDQLYLDTEDRKLETKPGWKTTEFWITMICQGTGLALLFGWIDPPQAEVIKEVGNMATSNIFEIIMMLYRFSIIMSY